MTGRHSGVMARIKAVAPDFKSTHCIVHIKIMLCESQCTELILHADIRWLSRGKVLSRIFEL